MVSCEIKLEMGATSGAMRKNGGGGELVCAGDKGDGDEVAFVHIGEQGMVYEELAVEAVGPLTGKTRGKGEGV